MSGVCDRARRVLDQVAQHLERTRLQLHAAATVPKLVAREVERELRSTTRAQTGEREFEAEVEALLSRHFIGALSADPDKLLQAIRNLLENAWKYTPEDGLLEVSVERREQTARVIFSNSGPIIPTAELSLIFERFYRIDPSRSRDVGGAGIGLAIVRELIEAHGGRVGAESDDDSTRIWFELPLA